MKKLFAVAAVLSLALGAGLLAYTVPFQVAHADYSTTLPSPVNSLSDLFRLIDKVLGFVWTVLIIMSIITMITAAVTYITSQGDSTKTATANKMILYAAIGLGVAVLSKALGTVIQGVFQ